MGGLPAWRMEVQLPLQNLKIYLMDLSLFVKVYIFRMRFNLNKIFVSDSRAKWAYIRLNKPKWAQKKFNES